MVKELSEAEIYVLSVTTTPKAFPKTAALAKGQKRIKTALGLHPQLAMEREKELSLFDIMLAETGYVGEVGLDGGKEFKVSREAQLRVFNHILKTCAGVGGKIISIHSRHAAKEVLECLDCIPDCGTPVFHWFTGNQEELKNAIDLGCWFSIGLPMLRSKKGNAAIKLIPKDRILTETDAPFTGKSIAANLRKTERLLSVVWSTDEAETKAVLASNLRKLVS